MLGEEKIKIMSCNSNRDLAEKIAARCKIPLSDCEISKFSDGEISVTVNDTVRGCDVFVVQSTNAPVNDNLMELLIMCDALKRASAGRIIAVMPYFGYARQDRKVNARDPISAKLVADLLTAAGVDKVLTMDLHTPQIQGFFNIPVDNLLGSVILAPYFKDKMKENSNVVVVSPDLGSVTRARAFAGKIEASLAIVDKRRPKANLCQIMNVIGDVKDKDVIIVDDMIDTAGTLCNAADFLKKECGANQIFACSTHGVLSGNAIERIKNSAIDEVVILDTIKLTNNKNIDKIVQLSAADVFAIAIERIYTDQPVSVLFE